MINLKNLSLALLCLIFLTPLHSQEFPVEYYLYDVFFGFDSDGKIQISRDVVPHEKVTFYTPLVMFPKMWEERGRNSQYLEFLLPYDCLSL